MSPTILELANKYWDETTREHIEEKEKEAQKRYLKTIERLKEFGITEPEHSFSKIAGGGVCIDSQIEMIWSSQLKRLHILGNCPRCGTKVPSMPCDSLEQIYEMILNFIPDAPFHDCKSPDEKNWLFGITCGNPLAG